MVLEAQCDEFEPGLPEFVGGLLPIEDSDMDFLTDNLERILPYSFARVQHNVQ